MFVALQAFQIEESFWLSLTAFLVGRVSAIKADCSIIIGRTFDQCYQATVGMDFVTKLVTLEACDAADVGLPFFEV